MKARNNKTGEIVTDFAISKEFGTISYFDSNKTLRLTTACDNEWTILDEENTFDWQSFRAEATKDILCAIINREGSDKRNDRVKNRCHIHIGCHSGFEQDLCIG